MQRKQSRPNRDDDGTNVIGAHFYSGNLGPKPKPVGSSPSRLLRPYHREVKAQGLDFHFFIKVYAYKSRPILVSQRICFPLDLIPVKRYSVYHADAFREVETERIVPSLPEFPLGLRLSSCS